MVDLQVLLTNRVLSPTSFSALYAVVYSTEIAVTI